MGCEVKEFRPIQLDLHIPGADDELDNALGYNLDAWHDAFVGAYIRLGVGRQSVREADALCGRTPRNDQSAWNKAHRLLNHKDSASNAVALAIENRKRRIAARAKFTEDEWFASVRHLRNVGFGETKIRKTIHRNDPDTGKTVLQDLWVYEPNLAGAAKAIELQGRNLRLLDQSATIEQGRDGAVTVRFVGVASGGDEDGDAERPEDA